MDLAYSTPNWILVAGFWNLKNIIPVYYHFSAPIWSIFSWLWSGSQRFSRNCSENGPDLTKQEELTLKIGLFYHEFNDEVDDLQSWKRRDFSKKSGKSLILWYWSGFKIYLGPGLVQIGTKKWSRFGPILINVGPIWKDDYLGKDDSTIVGLGELHLEEWAWPELTQP